jgi:hypothetical protein
MVKMGVCICYFFLASKRILGGVVMTGFGLKIIICGFLANLYFFNLRVVGWLSKTNRDKLFDGTIAVTHYGQL